MRKQRITQDYIAKRLNVSRNTVSKVFNNQPGISEETRKKVLAVANELEYKTNIIDTENNTANHFFFKDIAFVCHSDSLTSSFWAPIVRSTESVLNKNNANFRLVIIREYDETECIIPNSLISDPPDGVIMISRFSTEYYKAIINLGYPTVTLDISKDIAINGKISDVVMMEDFTSTYNLTKHIIEKGHTNIAFAGEKSWSYSFYCRWCGYIAAMLDNNLSIPDSIDFIINSENQIPQAIKYIYKKIKELDNIPTAFVCANDTIAATIDALQHPTYNLFDSISLSGFDNHKSINISSPNFSTVDPNHTELGKVLAKQILWRIKNPEKRYRFIHVESDLIFNE